MTKARRAIHISGSAWRRPPLLLGKKHGSLVPLFFWRLEGPPTPCCSSLSGSLDRSLYTVYRLLVSGTLALMAECSVVAYDDPLFNGTHARLRIVIAPYFWIAIISRLGEIMTYELRIA